MARAGSTPLKKLLRESPDLQKLRHKRRMLRVRLAILFSVLLVVLCVGFIFLTRYPKIQISSVVVTGNQITETIDVVAHVNKFLDGKYAYVIPHRNAYLYPKNKIVSDLMDSFPRFRSVDVSRQSPTALLINVNEVHAIALWCGVNIDIIDTNVPCYFTDDAGKVVATAPYYSGNVYRRFFGSTLLKAGDNPLGHQFIEPEAFRNLLIFSERISNSGFSIKGIRIGPGTENAFILDFGQGKTALIRFLAGADYRILASNFISAIGKVELSEQLKKNKSNLLYFDLRFTNKVYYKFSDAVVPTPTIAPATNPTTKKAVTPVVLKKRNR